MSQSVATFAGPKVSIEFGPPKVNVTTMGLKIQILMILNQNLNAYL